MDKPTEVDLGRSILSDSATNALKKAFESTDLIEALKLISSCFMGMAVFRCEKVIFLSSTGKTIELRWTPFEEWDGKIWLNSISKSPSLWTEDSLYKPLLQFLPEGKMNIVKIEDKRYVVRHVESLVSDWQYTGFVPNYIEFIEID